MSVSRDLARPARRLAVALCALAVALTALSGPALAADTHLFEGSFDGSATPAGAFSSPGRMAIDQSADLLYVIDTFNGAVVKFDVSGSPSSPTPQDFSALGSPALDGGGAGEADETPQGAFGFSGDADIAVDNSGTATDGNVYVVLESGFLYAFDGSGTFLYALDGTDPDGPDPLEGTPTSSLDNPCGVAVGADGSIYVSGYFASAVRKLTPAGGSATYASEVAVGSPACHIAVDSSDSLYVNHYGGDVEKFDSAGVSQGVVDPGSANSVAVAPDDHVFVDRGDRVVEYDSGGQVSQFGAGKLASSRGVAAGGSANSVFASDADSNSIQVFGPLVSVDPPTAEIDPVADPGVDTADLTGQVNPQGHETTAHFEYSSDGGTSWTALSTHDSATDPDLADSTGDVQLTDQVTGLQPNTAYQARLVAANPGGETIGTPVSFTTDPDAPQAATRPADLVTSTKALLGGFVNPRNSQTAYYFEYSTDPDLPPGQTTSVPAGLDGDAGAGGKSVDASEPIAGLAPETTYHYRFTATNEAGTSVGDVQAFTTRQAPVAQACSNERSGPSAKLAHCRAYEQVSPQDKNGASIQHYRSTNFASPDGDALAYVSSGGFADVHGSAGGGTVQYAAYRGAGGWATRAVTPTPAPDSIQGRFGETVARVFSDSLDRAVVKAYDLPGASDDAPGAVNFYSLDIASGALDALTEPLEGFPLTGLQTVSFDGALFGASRDARDVIFDSAIKLLDEAPATGRKLYHWDGGTLRLAGILPDGSLPPSGGSGLAGGSANSGGGGGWQKDTISADGSRFAFLSPATGSSRQLYVRKNDVSTVRVSQSEGATPVATPGAVNFWGATPDLDHVLFTTTSQLTDDDPGGGGTALYRYTDSADPANDQNLTFIDRAGGGIGVMGLSDDAQRIYYGGGHLWDHGTSKAVFPPDVVAGDGGNFPLASRGTASDSRVSPDGRYFAFLNTAQLTSAPLASECRQGIGMLPPVGTCVAMYLYDAVEETLRCVSCPPTGDPARSGVFTMPTDRTSSGFAGGSSVDVRNRFLADDGRVFFSTADALVASDVNGNFDAYEFDPRTGEVSLLSSGTVPDDSWFADASADGDDVFVTTGQRLVGWDRDGLVDMYDARTGGGFAEPEPVKAPCSGDECQDTSSGAPPASGVGSNGLSGSGNLDRPLSGRFSLARIGIAQRRLFARKGRVVLRIRVPRAGRLVAGSNRTSGASRRVAEAGTTRLTLRLTGGARQRLRVSGRLRVRIIVRFGGAARTATLVLRSAK
jgi:hypothetical protein